MAAIYLSNDISGEAAGRNMDNIHDIINSGSSAVKNTEFTATTIGNNGTKVPIPMLVPKKISMEKGLARVVGNDDLKKIIWDDIILLEHGYSHTLGWVLAGASGSGKTFFIEALKEDLNPDIWIVEKVNHQWDGQHHQVTKLIHKYFEELKTKNKLILLDIPECENKMMSRADTHSGSTRVSRATTNTLLDELTTYKVQNLYILASTNRAGYIDSAFLSNSTRFAGVYYMVDYTFKNWTDMCNRYLPELTSEERAVLATSIYNLNLVENNYSKKWTPGDLNQIHKDLEADKILSEITGVQRTIDIIKKIDEINKRKAAINNRIDFVQGVK